MKKLLVLSLLLTGCASVKYRVVGWYGVSTDTANHVMLENGKVATIVGNPRITCYTDYGHLLADGYFVNLFGGYLVVDQFGKDYVWLNDSGNYCVLGDKE